jgi:hypothetical protein
MDVDFGPSLPLFKRGSPRFDRPTAFGRTIFCTESVEYILNLGWANEIFERSGKVDELGNTRPHDSSQAIEGFLLVKLLGSNMQDKALAKT